MQQISLIPHQTSAVFPFYPVKTDVPWGFWTMDPFYKALPGHGCERLGSEVPAGAVPWWEVWALRGRSRHCWSSSPGLGMPPGVRAVPCRGEVAPAAHPFAHTELVCSHPLCPR